MGLYSRRRKTKVFPKCTILVIGWLQVKVLYFPDNGNIILTFCKAILFSDLKLVNEKIIKTQLVRFAMPLERYILWWKYTFCKIWEVKFWNLRNTISKILGNSRAQPPCRDDSTKDGISDLQKERWSTLLTHLTIKICKVQRYALGDNLVQRGEELSEANIVGLLLIAHWVHSRLGKVQFSTLWLENRPD